MKLIEILLLLESVPGHISLLIENMGIDTTPVATNYDDTYYYTNDYDNKETTFNNVAV